LISLSRLHAGLIDLNQCCPGLWPAGFRKGFAVYLRAQTPSAESEMAVATGDIVVGVMAALLGLLGLILGAGAVDDGMYVFGLSLFAFACLFGLGQIRRHYGRVTAARAHREPALDTQPGDTQPGESRHV
jgi:hypothetical protein